MTRRLVRILVNPSARSGRGLGALRALRGQRPDDLIVEWIETRSGAHLQDLVRAAQGEDLCALGLAGGDGTVALALNALDGPGRLPLGLLPVGSGNDFAKEAGVPRQPSAAFTAMLQAIRQDASRAVDVGTVTPLNQRSANEGSPSPALRRFCCVASVGLDEIALRVIHGSAFPRSKALNIYGALRALLAYRPRAVRLTYEGGAFEGEVMFAAITNTRSYGGGFVVSPAALLDDGALDVCIVKRTARLSLLAQFPRILRGTHGASPDVILLRSPWVRIESLGAPLLLCLDGELPQGEAPVELRVARAGARVLVPHRESAAC